VDPAYKRTVFDDAETDPLIMWRMPCLTAGTASVGSTPAQIFASKSVPRRFLIAFHSMSGDQRNIPSRQPMQSA
jgi:hypothetical protein